jgi:hypothetical protein
MLQTISWKDYFITIGLGTVLYYGWWLFRYYAGWKGRGRKDAVEAGTTGVAAGVGRAAAQVMQEQVAAQERVAAREQAVAAEVVQPELGFPAVVVALPVFLPVVAGNLRNDILRLMDKVRPAEAGEAELLELLRGLLAVDPYPILKGTGFQEEVNALIVREMERYGSIRVDPEVVSGLWVSEVH